MNCQNNMENKILDLIKKYQKIIIARHIGPDPDALGATFALKEILKENFSDKEVHVVGTPIAKFKFFGTHAKTLDEFYNNSLLIVLDTPDIRRIDSIEYDKFDDVIKIDHHPEIDKFSDHEIIDEKSSSTCEMIAKLTYNLNFKIPKIAAENLFMGIVADTNRFLFQCSSYKTYNIVSKLIKDYSLNINELYKKLYKRSINEVRLEGLISLGMKLTENGVGYVKITDEELKKYNLDSASVGGIMNNYNFVNELLCWVVYTEDKKNNVIRTSARSRGPIINKLFEQYNGGGHLYACGAKLNSFSEADEITDKLDELCKIYNEGE